MENDTPPLSCPPLPPPASSPYPSALEWWFLQIVGKKVPSLLTVYFQTGHLLILQGRPLWDFS